MKVIYIKIISFLFVSVFLCCNLKEKSTYTKTVNKKYIPSDKLIGNKVEISEDFVLNRTSQNLVLIYFDGTCSQCIGETLNWIKKNNKIMKNNANYLFLSNSNDTYEIELHMKEMNIILTKNQYLKADTKGLVLTKNVFLNSYRNILLLNKENKILSSKDPFEDEIAMRIYKKHNIF